MNEGSIELYELDHDIYDTEVYMTDNGCPIELNLFVVSAPYTTQLATHNEIGWVDEGDDSEDMHEITVDDLNIILRNKMRCQVQCLDNPVFNEEKVIIRLIEEEVK
jgi:hypothetical protein